MEQPQQHQDQHGNDSKNLISGELLMYNMKQLDLVNIVMYLTGGSIAGILGLTGLHGLFLFILVTCLIQIGVFVKMGFNTQKYTISSIIGLAISAASAQALTFILFWTLAFALVHIY